VLASAPQPHLQPPPFPQELEALAASAVAALPPGECEVLYGRAGYLYSLLWLERQLGPGTISQGVVQVREGRREPLGGGGAGGSGASLRCHARLLAADRSAWAGSYRYIGVAASRVIGRRQAVHTQAAGRPSCSSI
jgi:hypothetical protein